MTSSGPTSPSTAAPPAALPPGSKAQQGPFAHEVLNTILVDPAVANPQSADDAEYQEAITRFVDVVDTFYAESDTFRKIADNFAQQTNGKTISFFFRRSPVGVTEFQSNPTTGSSAQVELFLNEKYNGLPRISTDLLKDGSIEQTKDNTWVHSVVHELGHALTGLLDFTPTAKEWLATFDPDYVASSDNAVLDYAANANATEYGVLQNMSTFMPGHNQRLVNTIFDESKTYHDATPIAAYSGAGINDVFNVISAYDAIRYVLKTRLPKAEFRQIYKGMPKTLDEFIQGARSEKYSEDQLDTIRTKVHEAWLKEYPKIMAEDGEDGHYDSLYGTFEQYQDRINLLLAQYP